MTEKVFDEVVRKINHDNKRRKLYEEVMPVIIEILNKYDGKRYGEKTREKMNDDLKEKCNCHFYLNNSHSEDIFIAPLNAEGFSGIDFKCNDFEVYVKHEIRSTRRPLDEENKIHGGFTVDDFFLSNCPERVENPEAHAEEILDAFAALKELQTTFLNSVSSFNTLLPSGIERLYITRIRWYL